MNKDLELKKNELTDESIEDVSGGKRDPELVREAALGKRNGLEYAVIEEKVHE